MEISTREITGRLLVDMVGPFPRDADAIEETGRVFCDAVEGRDHVIFVLKDVWPLESIDLGLLIQWLHRAEYKHGGHGDWPLMEIVSGDKRVRSLFEVVDSPVKVYGSEEEALSPEKASGCFGLSLFPVFVAGGAIFWLTAACT